MLAGRPLTPASRKWLAWVLADLASGDQVPHLARGNAIKAGARFERTRRLADLMQRLPAGPVGDRLAQAQKTLGMSFSTARALYYSDTFRAFAAASKQLPPT